MESYQVLFSRQGQQQNITVVTIAVEPGNLKKKTSSKGQAQIKSLATGTYNAHLQKEGFAAGCASVH